MKANLCIFQAGESVIWIAEIGRVKLGLSLLSGWCLKLGDEIRAIREPQDMVPLLPLLEVGRKILYAHLQAISDEVPHVDPLVMDFPEELLLRCAFEISVSDYWPLKGIEWLDLSPNLGCQLVSALCDLQKRSWATQMLKQKVASRIKGLCCATHLRAESP